MKIFEGSGGSEFAADEIIDGSLTLDQEKQFFRGTGRHYFILALSKQKEVSIQQINKVKLNPNRETFSSFIDYLTTVLENLEYQDWPNCCSEVLFNCAKYAALDTLRESLEIPDADIASIFTQRFDLLEDISHSN